MMDSVSCLSTKLELGKGQLQRSCLQQRCNRSIETMARLIRVPTRKK